MHRDKPQQQPSHEELNSERQDKNPKEDDDLIMRENVCVTAFYCYKYRSSCLLDTTSVFKSKLLL